MMFVVRGRRQNHKQKIRECGHPMRDIYSHSSDTSTGSSNSSDDWDSEGNYSTPKVSHHKLSPPSHSTHHTHSLTQKQGIVSTRPPSMKRKKSKKRKLLQYPVDTPATPEVVGKKKKKKGSLTPELLKKVKLEPPSMFKKIKMEPVCMMISLSLLLV